MSAEKINSFDELFKTGLDYIYDAETLLTEALPKMGQAASSTQLRQAFEQHLQETQNHVTRLEQVFSKLGLSPTVRSNTVMQAMIQEAEGMIRTIETPELRDVALVLAGNQVEHFEIGSYGSLRTFAERMGQREVVSLLDQTLQEEKQADRILTDIGESEVNPRAAQMQGQLTR